MYVVFLTQIYMWVRFDEPFAEDGGGRTKEFSDCFGETVAAFVPFAYKHSAIVNVPDAGIIIQTLRRSTNDTE